MFNFISMCWILKNTVTLQLNHRLFGFYGRVPYKRIIWEKVNICHNLNKFSWLIYSILLVTVSPNSNNRVRKPVRPRKDTARSTGTSYLKLNFYSLHYVCHFTDKYFSLEFEVEQIVARRLDPEVVKMGIATTDPTLFTYQLKWKGYKQMSWVPFEDLNCPDLLDKFLKSVS